MMMYNVKYDITYIMYIYIYYRLFHLDLAQIYPQLRSYSNPQIDRKGSMY